MEIRSVSNEKIKYLRKAFSSRKFAKEEGIFFLTGLNLYKEFMESGHEFKYVLYAPSQLIQKGKESFLDELNKLEKVNSSKFLKVTKVILGKFSSIAEDQGVMVIGKRFSYTKEGVLSKSKIIFLYDVQDPGNVGTIFRLAEGNNAAIILTRYSASPFNEKSVRASMGSILRTPFIIIDSPEEIFSNLRDSNFTIVSTSVRASKKFWEIDYTQKITFILGNEGHGVPEAVKQFADEIVSIPMEGKVESYNVAVSAAILLCPGLIRSIKEL